MSYFSVRQPEPAWCPNLVFFHSQGLHQSAVDKGLTILNEIGLDPGIDHMLAKCCIDEVHDRGGQVIRIEIQGYSRIYSHCSINFSLLHELKDPTSTSYF